MLKIKDEVDLKELEKFGFKKNKNNNWIYLQNKTTYFYRDDKKLKKEIHAELIRINTYREIMLNVDIKTFPKEQIDGYGSNISELDIIYDLIQAGIVEKVSDR